MSGRDEVTVTFTCSSNTAVLLLTCYDIVRSSDNYEELQDSIVAMENYEWLIDELLDRLPALAFAREREPESWIVPLIKQREEQLRRFEEGAE